MALKILTIAEDMPDAKEKHQRVYAYTKRKRAPTFRNRAALYLTAITALIYDGSSWKKIKNTTIIEVQIRLKQEKIQFHAP
jgi:hypothetical protein